MLFVALNGTNGIIGQSIVCSISFRASIFSVYMNESFGLAAFRSRTQVLRMENALHRAGLSAGVIATPREIAVGCGLSVRFDLSDTPQVLQIYRRLNPGALIGFYRAEGYGTRRLTLTPLIEKR
mgnify:CR=1 FL=1